jgi:hypothetical protein
MIRMTPTTPMPPCPKPYPYPPNRPLNPPRRKIMRTIISISQIDMIYFLPSNPIEHNLFASGNAKLVSVSGAQVLRGPCSARLFGFYGSAPLAHVDMYAGGLLLLAVILVT